MHPARVEPVPLRHLFTGPRAGCHDRRCRLQGLPLACVNTAATCGGVPVSAANGKWTSTVRDSRRACGTTTSGTPQATNPSASTWAPSGREASARPSACRAFASGHGHAPGSGISQTRHPAAANPWHTRRS